MCHKISRDKELWQEKVLDQLVSETAKGFLQWEDKEPDTYATVMTKPDGADGDCPDEEREGEADGDDESFKSSKERPPKKEPSSGKKTGDVTKSCNQHPSGSGRIAKPCEIAGNLPGESAKRERGSGGYARAACTNSNAPDGTRPAWAGRADRRGAQR